MYVGVDGKVRKVKNVYVGINDIARTVKNIYAGINDVSKQSYRSDVYLYDYGKINNLAGGWNSSGYDFGNFSASATTYSANFEDNRIVLKNQKTYAFCSIRTNNTYNLSKFSRLQVVYESPKSFDFNDGVRFHIGIVSKNNAVIAQKKIMDSDIISGTHTLSLDFKTDSDGFASIMIGTPDDGPQQFIIYIKQVLLS